MPDTKLLVLIADDDPDDREAVRHYLPKEFACIEADNEADARRILLEQPIYIAFVDLFLDENDYMPFGFKILRDFPHVPVLLMSGQNPGKVEAAMRQFDDQRLRMLNKDNDLEDYDAVASAIKRHAEKHYNQKVTFEFSDKLLDWEALAGKFVRNGGAGLGANKDKSVMREEYGLELMCLAQKAFCGWDESESPHVEATRISIERVLGSSSTSVVMLMRPFSKFGDAQADVIFKVARINAKPQDDHTQFDQFKNIVGGYGLRERRYKRTCRFHGQVYAVPYYKFEDTQTYAEFYRAVDNDDECLEKIESLTKYLFRDALNHLLHRRPTNLKTLRLSDYYAQRIKWERRRDAIADELMNDTPPISIRDIVEGDDLVIGRGAALRKLRNPLKPVLMARDYRRTADMADTAVRHGDLHAENVLVDTEYNHLACWYIDYESFGSDHFILTDHAEFEASVLFSLMKTSENYEFWMRFVDAITDADDLSKLDESVAALGPDKPDRAEAAKALAAIKPIRASAQEINGRAAPRDYYHAMMYEALRVAGKREGTLSRRWFALITAAQLFERIEG
jgi:CheY-like chemotaxis protein